MTMTFIASTNKNMINSLELYFSEIRKFKPLNEREEKKLARKIKLGDRKAKEKLIECNLKFVVTVAKQYQNQGISLEDLINIGNIGLIKAVENFNPDKNFKLISYAVWWIRQAILRALSEQSRCTNVPLNQVATITKINKFIEKFENKFYRKPTVKQISDAIEASEKIIFNLLSLDKQIYLDDSDSKFTLSVTDHNINSCLDDLNIKKILDLFDKRLNKREKSIMIKYYNLNHSHDYTLEEIGIEENLTRERIRQIKDQAERKLNNTYFKNLLMGEINNEEPPYKIKS